MTLIDVTRWFDLALQPLMAVAATRIAITNLDFGARAVLPKDRAA
jgi:hypothetical protein